MKREAAIAVMVSAAGIQAKADVKRLIEANYPRVVMTKEGPRYVEAATRADKMYARRQVDRSQNNIARLANLLLADGGFTTTGQSRKRK